jgi:hypothetical protein
MDSLREGYEGEERIRKVPMISGRRHFETREGDEEDTRWERNPNDDEKKEVMMERKRESLRMNRLLWRKKAKKKIERKLYHPPSGTSNSRNHDCIHPFAYHSSLKTSRRIQYLSFL